MQVESLACLTRTHYLKMCSFCESNGWSVVQSRFLHIVWGQAIKLSLCMHVCFHKIILLITYDCCLYFRLGASNNNYYIYKEKLLRGTTSAKHRRVIYSLKSMESRYKTRKNSLNKIKYIHMYLSNTHTHAQYPSYTISHNYKQCTHYQMMNPTIIARKCMTSYST